MNQNYFNDDYYSLEFCKIEKFSSPNTGSFNLFNENFDTISYLSRDFVITTINRSYKFNIDMIKHTSSILYCLISNNSNFSQFHLNILDTSNTMEKFERLYLGEQVIFYKDDFTVAKKIVDILNINNFPSFDDQAKEIQIEIKKSSFIRFLQKTQFQVFTISTNKHKYKCNFIGINSSAILKELIKKDPKLNSYSYDLNDDKEEFKVISNFFNFESFNIHYDINTQNMYVIKKIIDDLRIECLYDKINNFINYYEFIVQFVDSKRSILEPVDDLFELLYNRKNLPVEHVSQKIVESIWSHTESNVQELVACIIQVVYTDVLLHPFLMNLIELLDKSKSDKNDLKILIPFLVQKLMTNIGCNKLNCAFIYRLSQKEIIKKEEIAETIIDRLALSDAKYQLKKEFPQYKFINKYLNKFVKFDYKCVNNVLVWFFPELMEIKNISKDDISDKLDDDHKQFFLQYQNSDFKKMRESGEPDNRIIKALRHDDVDELKLICSEKPIARKPFGYGPLNKYSNSSINSPFVIGKPKKPPMNSPNPINQSGFGKTSKPSMGLGSFMSAKPSAFTRLGQSSPMKSPSLKNNNKNTGKIVPFNIFESFVPNGYTSYLNYAAAYGSIKCFKYLISINEKIDINTFVYAVFGQNKELIEITDKICMNQKKGQKIDLSLFEYNSNSSDLPTLYLENDIRTKMGEALHPVLPALMKHNNELFNCILEHKYNLSHNLDMTIVKKLFKNYNAKIIMEYIKSKFILPNLSKDHIMKIIKISASKGYCKLTELVLGLFFNYNNKEFLKYPFSIINFEDSVSFGNLSIFQLYASINFEHLNFKNSLAIAILREYSKIVEFSLVYPFIQKYSFSTNDIEDLLKLALYKKKTDSFDFLIKKLGENIIVNDYPVQSSNSLLCYACTFGNINAVKKIANLILEKNPKSDCTMPFINAACQGYDEICEYLIGNKVILDFSIIISKASILSRSHKETFSMIYDIANQETKEVLSNAIFIEAIKSCNKDLVEFLLTKNVQYDYALLEAVSTNDVGLVNIVLNHDSSPLFVNKTSKNGTALNIAAKLNNEDIVKRLLSISGINPSICTYEETPLISAFANFNVKIVNMLFDFYGDEIQSQTWQFNIALRHILYLLNEKYCQFKSSAPEIIKKLLEIKNIDYNCVVENYNLFAYACDLREADIVDTLIKNENVNVNTFNCELGNSPLMIAIGHEFDEIASKLIQNDRIDINQRNYKGETALTIAVRNRLHDIVDLIMNHKKFDPKQSNLDYAFFISSGIIANKLASHKDLNVNFIYQDIEPKPILSNIEQMKKVPAKPFGFNQLIKNSKETTLINAIKYNYIEKIDLIIQHQSFDPIKSRIIESISLAASKNLVPIFNKLLSLIDNDVNASLQNNESLLYVASINNSNSIIQEIVNNSKFDSLKSGIFAAFAALLSNNSEISLDMLDLLLKHDDKHLINFNQLLPNGKSFFTIISPYTQNIRVIIKYLIDHGADCNCPDKFGITPLQYAIMIRSLVFIDALICSKKIDFSQKIHFEVKYNEYDEDYVTSTYLHLAAKSDIFEIFKRILDLNVFDVNITDSNGETPLIIATRYKRVANIKELFKKDDLNHLACNNKCEDAYDVSDNKKHFFKPYSKEDFLLELS